MVWTEQERAPRPGVPASRPARVAWCWPLGLLFLGTGCSNLRTTDPGRTATEQFLMSEAAILAVEQLSLEALRGRDVYVDTSYFASNEQPFILGEFRARCLREGVQMTSVRDEAQVIVEVRSGGVGIDRKDFLFGIPALLLTAGGDDNVASRVPILTPEIAFVKNIEQKGFASIAFVAFWAQTGEVISSSGPFVGRTLRDDWWFFGFGPQTVGNIPPVEKADQ